MATTENNSLKSLVILTGAVVGFIQGMRVLGFSGERPRPDELLTKDNIEAAQSEMAERISVLEGRLAALIAQGAEIEGLRDSVVLRADVQGLVEQTTNTAVEKAVSATWERLAEIEVRTEQYFSGAERSAEALRRMIQDTDQMLERVIEGLDLLAESRLTGSRADR